MTYWHLQMHLPEGKDGTKIDSREMLEEPNPVIGTGEWEDQQCDNFKSRIQIGDIVFIREGNKAIALCQVIDNTFTDGSLTKKYLSKNFRHVKVLQFASQDKDMQPRARLFSQGTLNSCSDENKEQCIYIKNWYNKVIRNMEISKTINLLKKKKNIIIQGAPGTGKTYNTAAIAVGIADGVENIPSDHSALMKRYNTLCESGKIEFCTFHQSMDYEDFVEGLKPKIIDDKVEYTVEPGIFKRICKDAQTNEKMDIIKCIEDYLQDIKGFENKKEIPTITGKSHLFVWWKEGNNTISTRSTLSKSEKEDYSPSPLNIEKVKLQALGEGFENNWTQYAEAFINAVKKEYDYNKDVSNKPYILIIDEINRGNVSKIFGELITLLEADKRLGSEHPISVTLPYSKEKFSVPANLYIIGTMNTTDRSTGTIDYAVRRRFAFITLESDRNVIDNQNNKVKDKALNLFDDVKLYITDHKMADIDISDLMIGHSYFLAETEDDLKLKIEFEVIPLIREYIKDGILEDDEEKNKVFSNWKELNIKHE